MPVLAAAKQLRPDQKQRFSYRNPNFRSVTCILDGVPVFSRGSFEDFNKKHESKYKSFQVLCALNGAPIDWSTEGCKRIDA